MGYYPSCVGFLTRTTYRGGRQCQAGNVDWGGRLLKGNGGAQRFPQNGWKSFIECKGIRELDCETYKSSGWAKTEIGSGLRPCWAARPRTDKSYPGDNRLISPKSSHRRGVLAPRCRLIASWGCSRSQGLGCSPIKAVRELGSERRETVRSLSVVGVGNLRGAVLSTRGPGWTYLWCTSCRANGIAG